MPWKNRGRFANRPKVRFRGSCQYHSYYLRSMPVTMSNSPKNALKDGAIAANRSLKPWWATIRRSRLNKIKALPTTPDLLSQDAINSLSCVFCTGRALSGEGVVSSHSVVATELVSRHRSEFGTLRAVRFCGLEAVAQAIFGALESLQRRSKTARLQAVAQQLRNRLPAARNRFLVRIKRIKLPEGA